MTASVATRDSFGDELANLGASNPRIVCLDADLAKSTKSEKFAKKFPDRFFEMGIAEANMIGTAAGLALSGKIPFACSFGCFITGRYDQIRMSVSYNRANVKIIGTHAGVAIGEDGHSQMGLEDLHLLRAIPNMNIYQPVDDVETRSLIRYVAAENNPCYIRLTRQKVPTLLDPKTYVFEAGKWPVLRKGKGVAIVASGGVVGNCLNAVEQLKRNYTVVNASSIKPGDVVLMSELAKDYDHIVTAEDHYITGGVGSVVSEFVAGLSGSRAQVHRIGVENFGESGSPEDLMKHFMLDAEGIAQRLERLLSRA